MLLLYTILLLGLHCANCLWV